MPAVPAGWPSVHHGPARYGEGISNRSAIGPKGWFDHNKLGMRNPAAGVSEELRHPSFSLEFEQKSELGGDSSEREGRGEHGQ